MNTRGDHSISYRPSARSMDAASYPSDAPRSSRNWRLQDTLTLRSVAAPLEWAFACIVMVLGFWVDIPYLQSDPGWAVLYLLGGCLFLVRGPFLHMSRDHVVLALVAFLTLAGLSVFWSYLPMQSFRSAVALMGTTLLGAYLARTFSTADLVKVLLAALTFTALASLAEAIASLGPSALVQLSSPGSWQGILLHKNELGLSMSLLLGLTAISIRWSTVPPLIGVMILALATYLIYQSDAQGAWVSAPIVFGLAWMLPRVRRDLSGWFGLFLLIAGTLIALSSAYVASTLRETWNDPTALTGRSGFWREIVSAIEDRPWLGYGFKGFWNGLAEPSRAVSLVNPNFAISHAHNVWLEVALSLGVIGAGLFAVFFAVFSLRSSRLAFGRPGPDTHLFFMMACLMFIHSMVEAAIPLYQSTYWMLMVIFTLRMAVLTKQEREHGAAGAVAVMERR